VQTPLEVIWQGEAVGTLKEWSVDMFHIYGYLVLGENGHALAFKQSLAADGNDGIPEGVDVKLRGGGRDRVGSAVLTASGHIDVTMVD
jgi:hypothetical protein